ncbi:hypothetical protein J8273_0729 [Carpediemonas membranifera]|uniref:Uncharacterized protein n=1 Tax=Carpediemonas membranifera TaxID=201153 RepID=A0A8J6E2G2_9EUKA|nr:hypothetical protein J8273_0729 [Carpediemonas membranifera]|eukprot:KAG9397599.1 hypothetical protein J8273_0729 [Carpediemonas membranifera]
MDDSKVDEILEREFPYSLLIWEQLKPYVPPPEVPEIELMLGRVVDDNRGHLDHLRALFTVLLDIEERNDERQDHLDSEQSKLSAGLKLFTNPQRAFLQKRIDMLMDALKINGRASVDAEARYASLTAQGSRNVRSADPHRPRARTATPRPSTESANGSRSLGLGVVGYVNVNDLHKVEDTLAKLLQAEASFLQEQQEWLEACLNDEVDRHLTLKTTTPSAPKVASTEELRAFAAELESALGPTSIKPVLAPVTSPSARPKPPATLPSLASAPGLPKAAPGPRVSRARQRLYTARTEADGI